MIRFITKFFLMFFIVVGLGACASKPIPDLKSPCVAADAGENSAEHPCGSRKPVNDHWLS